MAEEKIFVLAPEELAEECMAEAMNWSMVSAQTKFKDNDDIKMFSVQVIAEYLANKKGFTLYMENAKYPKKDKE